MVNRIYALFAAIVSAIEKLAAKLKSVETASQKADTITEGVFSVARGGTGKASVDEHSILLGSGENPVAELKNAKGVLVSDGNASPRYEEFLPGEYGGNGRSGGAPHKPVLLWMGTWSSGSITVSKVGGSAGCTGLGDISDYKWVRVARGDMVSFDVPVYSDGLYFGGIWGNSDGVGQINVAHIRRNGNVLTYYYNTRLNMSLVQQASGEPITAIYGLTEASDIITS